MRDNWVNNPASQSNHRKASSTLGYGYEGQIQETASRGFS